MTKVRNTWEQMRNVPGLGSNILAVIVVLLVGLVATAFLLPKYDITFPWSSEHRFSAVVQKAPGMRDTSKHRVSIAGIEVGKVRAIEALPDDTARIDMAIGSVHKVYNNAHVEVRTLSVLGDDYAAHEPGDPATGELPEGGTIPITQTSRFVQPNEALDKLDDRTRQAVTSLVTQADVALRDAPRDLPGGLNAADSTLTRVQPVVRSLQTRRATIQKLVTNLSYLSTAAGKNDQRLGALLDELHQVLGVLSQRDSELTKTLEQLPGFRSDLDHAVTSASDLTGQLNPTLDDVKKVTDQLPDAVDRLSDTVEQAGPVVQQLKPVIAKARPVVADLKPLVPDVHAALDDLKPVSTLLPDATCRLVPWLPNLQAFVYQTSSAFSVADANGGLGRAQITLDLANPAGGTQPMPNFTVSDRTKECR